MLSEREKWNVRSILDKVSTRDLLQLADTVTNFLTRVNDREAAITAIVQHTECLDEFFRRRLVKKELIFNYLADCNEPVSAGLDMRSMVEIVLQYWDSQAETEIRLLTGKYKRLTASSQTTMRTTGGTNSTSRTTKSPSISWPGLSASSPPYASSGAATADMRTFTYAQNISVNNNDETISRLTTTMRTTPPASTISPTKSTGIFPGFSSLSSPPSVFSRRYVPAYRETSMFAEDTSVNNDNVTVPAVDQCQRDAEQFSEKFFSQLNQLHQRQPVGSTSDWGPNYFMTDATLKIRELEESQTRDFFFKGSEEIASNLGSLVKNQGLCFNPNLSREGTRGRRDPHGLVLIEVCGTIHEAHRFFGIFEQQCGLVMDPLAGNSWKIQFIKMKTKIGSTQITPNLSGQLSLI